MVTFGCETLTGKNVVTSRYVALTVKLFFQLGRAVGKSEENRCRPWAGVLGLGRVENAFFFYAANRLIRCLAVLALEDTTIHKGKKALPTQYGNAFSVLSTR
jgi:hypothetical protein